MMWSWDPCDTGPETYVMREYLIAPPTWYERCYLDDDAVMVCVQEAAYMPPWLALEQHTPFTFLADSGVDPPAGGAILIDVQAQDEAGNTSMGECQ